ncbi:uncharacterized protein LOC132920384 [Rhopalosiphum padi]|uniref:uncharacterized protein LOC132920384 n=1 Tax=Rhopalosiphum padi TaxID=40932 RepID=UPI00298ECB61|nr:uncharacterized protein LOC132920384 [Rhopalosiphum padi]
MIGKICVVLCLTIGGFVYVESEFCPAHTPTLDFVWNLGKEAFCVFVKYSNDDFVMAFESSICNDGSKLRGSYCGVGKCNWFGHNCDGGCRKSGHTTPPDNCDEIYSKRDEILSQYEYCTAQVENEPSPYGLATHGGLLKSYSYKNECITTCATARNRYEKVRYDCRVASGTLVPLEVLSMGTLTPIIVPSLVHCAVVENVLKLRMDNLCDN